MSNTTKVPSDRWLHTSCLQKAIRRNLPDLAVPSARFLWEFSPRYLMRRLGVIAFEDIGLANLGLVERYLDAVLPILAEGKFGGGDRERVIGFVRAFCDSPKSRFLTRITATVHYHPRYQAITAACKDPLLNAPVPTEPDDVEVMATHARMLACKPRDVLLALELTHPRLARIMAMGMKIGAEGLPLALFATRNEKAVETLPTNLPPIVMYGWFPNFVYDSHTRLGARALKLFTQQVPEFSNLTPETAAWVAYRILFRLESGLLDRETMFTSEEAVERVWWTTLMVEGLSLPDVFTIRESLRRRIPALNAIRRTLLGSPS